MKEEEFDKPEVKQAIEDLAEGKKTKAVEEFLKKYEITPKNQTEQSINNQNSEAMAKKNQTQQPVVEANDQQQNNQYRYNESMINW
ncbi:MAG: copper amine oxidase, partial [Lachnospira sp.]|nr:copper amine oxidase [Lachnospira sp.]